MGCDVVTDGFQDFLGLRAGCFAAALVVDDVGCDGDFFFERHLGIDTLLGFGSGDVVACEQAFDLGFAVDGDDDQAIEEAVNFVFDQEGSIVDDEGMALVCGGLRFLHHGLCNTRVRNGVEFQAKRGVGEYFLAERGAVQAAAFVEDLGAKGLDDFVERGLAGFDDLARDLVGVDDVDAEFAEHGCDGGFAAGDSAGKSHDDHWLVR